MHKIDFSKMSPIEVMRTGLSMYQEEMEGYTDPATKKLREDYAVDVLECPACGGSSAEADFVFQKDPFSYFQCSLCCLVYVNPRLDDENTEKLYTAGRCMYQLKNFYLPTAEYRKDTIYKRKLGDIEQDVEKGVLLDFGSSTGYFMKTAEESGWSVYGVELNPFGVQWAREKLGLENVYGKDIRECGFSEGQFDVITMWDVLEHLPNPHEILTVLRPFLRDEGMFVVETSHFDCLETDVLGSENTNVAGDIHLMHFTEQSLRVLLERSGYHHLSTEIFGLDVKHIVDYHKLRESDEFKIPEESVSHFQACVDKARKGCYIKMTATVKG